jgi:hypothetical protein
MDIRVVLTGRKAASMNPRKKRVNNAAVKLFVMPVNTLISLSVAVTTVQDFFCDSRDRSPNHHGSCDVPGWPLDFVYDHVTGHLDIFC